MRPATERLAAVDEANLVLDHAGQVNVFLVAGLLSPGGFVSPDGTPDLATVRSALDARIAELPPLRKVPVAAGRRHRWAECRPTSNITSGSSMRSTGSLASSGCAGS